MPEKGGSEANSTEVESVLENVTEAADNEPVQPQTPVSETEHPTPIPNGSTADPDPESADSQEAFEKGKIAGLQEAVLAIMEKNGPVTEQMKHDVYNQTHHQSLINWIKSFR